ncbi:MAG TPA: tetratricopeptide repeat protein [Dongiaceae bacterium]|jgi:tetratricopeptide (TPR) repeat protein
MASSFEEQFERAETALSDDDYPKALAAFEDALNSARLPHQRARSLDGMANASFHLKKHERAFDLLDQAIASCLPIADTDKLAAMTLARAWYDKAGMCAETGKVTEALSVLDRLVDRFSDRACAIDERDREELYFRLTVVRSASMKATALRKLDRKREAVACYDDMIRRFQPIDDVAVEDAVSRAMLNRAWLLGDLGREDEEIKAYESLVERYGNNHLLRVSHTIIDALTGKLQCYREQEDFVEALKAADDLISRYEFDPGRGIAERVARTMIRRADLLNKMGRTEEELAAYDKVVTCFGHWKEPDVRLHAAKALMFKAVSLNDADQSAAEIECYDELIRRYGQDKNEEVRTVAADALTYKGMSLGAIAEDAAEDTGEREIEAEIACYDEVIRRYGEEEFVGLQCAVAEALLHKGETLVNVGRPGEASACFDAIIQNYAAIEDTNVREIVGDARDLKAQI